MINKMKKISISELIENEKYRDAYNAWEAEFSSLASAKRLGSMREGMQVLVALSKLVEDIVDGYVESDSLLAALELSLLRKLDYRAYNRLNKLFMSFSSISRTSTPIALATETLRNHEKDAIARVARAIRAHKLWQLSKLFRYPAFKNNSIYFRLYLQRLLEDEESFSELSNEAAFKVAILAYVIAPAYMFKSYIEKLQERPIPQDAPEPISRALNNLKKHLAPQVPTKMSPLTATSKKRLKIAVCISGQMRGFRQCAPTLRHLNLKGHEITTVVHTWQNIGRRVPDPSIMGSVERVFAPRKFCEIFRSVSAEIGFAEMYVKFPTLFKSIEDSGTVNERDILDVYGKSTHVVIEKENSKRFVDFTNPEKMQYKIWAADKLARKVGAKYDLVLRIRPDRPISKNCAIPDWHQLSKFVHDYPIVFTEEDLGFRENLVVGDQIAVSSSTAMKKYANAWKVVSGLKTKPIYGFSSAIQAHSTIAYTLFHAGYNVRKLPGLVMDPLTDISKYSKADLYYLLTLDMASRKKTLVDDRLLSALND